MRYVLLLSMALTAAAQTPAYRELWNNPELVQRIEDGIRTNRMGGATLRFLDEKGRPVTNVQVSVDQTSHQFLFGANLFMLGGYESEAENRRWEERFLELFNYGTTPLYWPTLEPQAGKPRFASDSAKIYRRPPPDLAVEFAQRHGLTLKGHPLVYDQPLNLGLPDWVAADPTAVDRLLRVHMEQIAARYRDSIRVWDVVNEVFGRPFRMQVPMPYDFVFRSYQNAGRIFPLDDKLTVNEGTEMLRWPQVETSPYYLLIQNLRLRGARVDAIGFQCHLWSEFQAVLRGEDHRPLDMLRVLDRYADFRLPIHITEITVPTTPDTGEGEATQAEVARNLYRLWFSHPSVEAITWWNLADGTAFGDENRYNGGLVHRDLTPKPAFEALRKLIREEWHTHLDKDSGSAAEIQFRGFYGRYSAVVRHNGQTRQVEFRVATGAPNVVEVRL